ncbi:hypothetical protein BDR07DRAFT_1434128 [Suillus spraguei]|nr:hypothetical protein BDR07DRAFT_1434128 [Suillus spraguei]
MLPILLLPLLAVAQSTASLAYTLPMENAQAGLLLFDKNFGRHQSRTWLKICCSWDPKRRPCLPRVTTSKTPVIMPHEMIRGQMKSAHRWASSSKIKTRRQ